MKYMILFFSMIGVIVIVLLAGRIGSSSKFNRQVAELFSRSKIITGRTFNYEQLSGLPDPVQRYFNLVLKEGQPYISYVRMTHDGQFKTGLNRDWIDIEGEHYATMEKPGFIWKGMTSMFTAQDMYVDDKGRLTVSLLSLVKVVNGTGEQYNQGELLRWLGESVLYPTNLLPSERLHWVRIDDTSAKLMYNYNGLSLFFNITFNQLGEIVEMETQRYMDEKNLETWVIKLSDYKIFNSVLIPTVFEVLWRLEKGDFSYAKFNVKKLEYNNSRLF